jgi:hypothetical protein
LGCHVVALLDLVQRRRQQAIVGTAVGDLDADDMAAIGRVSD